MPISVVLAIGFDPWLLESQRTAWRSAGCFVTAAKSNRDAMGHLRRGDFDLILLDQRINREGMTSLVRACGSLTPVVCITDPPNDADATASPAFADAPDALLHRILNLLTGPKKPASERRGMPHPQSRYG